MNNEHLGKVLRMRASAVRPAGQATTPSSTDWWNTGGTTGSNVLDLGGGGGTGSTGGVLDQSGFGSTQNSGLTPQQSAQLAGQIAVPLITQLGGITTAVINSNRAEDIARTNAAATEAIARIRAEAAANPNSAQAAVAQTQIQALQAFMAYRDQAAAQQTRWLEYALLGVAGVAVVGGALYFTRGRGGSRGRSSSSRRNPVVGKRGNRHYITPEEYRRRKARRAKRKSR